MTGIDYPVVSVGEHKDLVVRMSLAAQLLMPRRGIAANELGTALAPTLPPHVRTSPPNPNAVKNYVVAFSCMVAENFVDREDRTMDLNKAPSADYWATRIDDFSIIENAVNEAIKKAVEERRKKLAAVPPQATEAAS